MPRLIDPGAGGAIALAELADALATSVVDVRDEDAFASLGPLLARLGRNRDFLAELAADELKTRCAAQSATGGYGPQVFLLRPPDGRFVLRANFWPAADDAVTRASGLAAFFYGMPHDHNFPFLTYGYFGPGYWSDDYDYDRGALAGVPGEDAGLRFAGRTRLAPGRLQLYRAGRDVHAQHPPDAFSVSLNILGADPAQPWHDQYRFDLARGTIAAGLSCTGAEALLALAVQFGNGADLAHDFARHHPCARMRVTAFAALASAGGAGAGQALWAEAADSPSAYVAGHARLRLARLEASQASRQPSP